MFIRHKRRERKKVIEVTIPIITIDNSYCVDELMYVSALGVRNYRINPARIGIENALRLYTIMNDLVNGAKFFFDTAGSKERISLSKTSQKEAEVLTTQNDQRFFISKKMYDDICCGDTVRIRNGSHASRMVVKEKKCQKIRVEIESDDNISLENNMHIYISNRYIPNISLNYIDKKIIEIFKNLGTVCLSFSDSVELVREAQDLVDGNTNIIAKIESPEGIKHAEEILNICDGLIIGRDDLSIFYNYETIHNIVLQLSDVCLKHDKMLIPASNYFLDLISSHMIDEVNAKYIREVMKCADYIYINETVINKSKDFLWRVVNWFEKQ